MCVFDPPFFDAPAFMPVIGEEVLVQAFVARPANMAFHETVPYRLARRDVVPLDRMLLPPTKDSVCVCRRPRRLCRDNPAIRNVGSRRTVVLGTRFKAVCRKRPLFTVSFTTRNKVALEQFSGRWAFPAWLDRDDAISKVIEKFDNRQSMSHRDKLQKTKSPTESNRSD